MDDNTKNLALFGQYWNDSADGIVREISERRNGQMQLHELFAILLGRGAAMGIVAASQYPEWGDRWSRALTNHQGVGNHPLWATAADLFFDLEIEAPQETPAIDDD